MSKSMVGFDIGAHEVKIVQWNGSQLVKAVTVPTPDSLIQDGRIRSYPDMAAMLKAATREHHIQGHRCAVIIPSIHAYLRRITIPAMTTDQLKVNLPYEFRDFLTQDKAQYFYDYAVNKLLKDEDGTVQQMDLTTCAVPKEVIEQYRTMFRKAGFKLTTAVPVECAYANLLRRLPQEGEKPREYCLVDLGHTATRIHIFTGGCFETSRESDLGLDKLHQVIAEDTRTDLRTADSLLTANQNGEQTLEYARDLYQSIANDVRKTVNFYGFNHQESDISELWCCGGGIYISALSETINQVLGLKLHTMGSLMPPAAGDLEDLSVYAAAIGAAIQ